MGRLFQRGRPPPDGDRLHGVCVSDPVWRSFRRRSNLLLRTVNAKILSRFQADDALRAGMDASTAFKLGLVNPALMFISNIIGYGLMSRFGRRTLYCTGMFGLMLFLILIGGLQKAADKVNPDAKWGIAAVTFAWNMFRAMTVGPECYSIVAESSSSRLRNQTIALARLTYQLVGLIVNFLEPWLMNPTALNLRGYTAFVWTPICFVGWLWCFFRLPEFKDRSVYELDVLFERKVAARNFASTEVEAYADDEIREDRHILQHA